MAYTKTNFIDGGAPGISAAELNKIGAGIENTNGNIKTLNKYGTATQANTFLSLWSVDVGLTIKVVELYCYAGNFFSEKFHLFLNANSALNAYSFYISKPDSSSTTRYKVDYYFSNGELRLQVPSDLIGFYFGANYYYTEG